MSGNKPRRGLASFLSNELKESEPTSAQTELASGSVTEVITEVAQAPKHQEKLKVARVAKVAVKPANKASKSGERQKKASKKTSKVPLYLRLTRKEARLREDQIDALAKVARRLTRARGGVGSERLTENTLLRVAVDLLLAHAGELLGTTESQLRTSVLGK